MRRQWSPTLTSTLLAMVSAGVLARLWLVAHPIEQLLTWTIADDGFYYLAIGRNIARGMGSTFDGVSLTNGYHPLWMVLNALVFAIIHTPLVAVRVLLVLELLMDVGAGLALAYLAWRVVGRASFAAIIGGLWFLSFRVVAVMQNGMETALSALAMNLCLLAAFALMQRRSWRREAAFGVLAGLTILARTDNALLVALLFVALLLHYRSPRPLIIPGLAVLLCTAPWFIWNYRQFGTLMQSSAQALTDINKMQMEAQFGTPLPLWPALVFRLRLWLDAIKRVYIYTGLPVGRWAPISLLWLAGGLALALFMNRSRLALWLEAASPAAYWLFAALAVWPILFITVHVSWRWVFRPYYYASLAPSVLLFFGLLLWGLLKSGRLARAWSVCLLPLTLFALYQLASGDLYRRQAAMLQTAQYLDANAQVCTTVGSFNAGILGFFYTGGRVVDLDGAVDNAAAETLHAGNLGEYARQQGVCYLADYETALGDQLDRPEWGRLRPKALSTPLGTADPLGLSWRYRLYRVGW
jgi:hypothetical protein